MGYKIKKETKNSARGLGNMEGKKGRNEVGKQRIGEKKRAMQRARARNQILFIIAAVVVLLLKFSRPFTNGIGCFMAFSLESSIPFLMSILRRNLTVPFLKFCCFFVVLVVPNFFARI